MTGWDIMDKFMGSFPPIAMVLMLIAVLAAAVIFIVGFSKHGFKQIALDNTLEKRFDKLESQIEAIETNHFGHLKNYLGILNGVLLDKQIIDNETKARLDNELRGM
jgi:hypothetical protein